MLKQEKSIDEYEDNGQSDNIQINDNDQEKPTILKQRLNDFYDEYYLSDFQKFAVEKFIRENLTKKDNEKVLRIKEWLFNKLNLHNDRKQIPEFQRGCPEIIPLLRAIPYWDSSQFEWIREIQSRFEIIKDELISLRNQKGFQPYRGPTWASKIQAKDGVGSLSNDEGNWNVFYLFLHDMKFEENCNKVPKTVDIIEKFVPRHYCHSFFSAVTPKTHIIKHNGPTNKKLRQNFIILVNEIFTNSYFFLKYIKLIHIPLIGFNKSRLRVADQFLDQQEGQIYIFDDSFEHEAWHDGDETRIVLIIDMWHPDLTDIEVKFLNLLQKAKLKFEHKISESNPQNDDFFNIIDKSRGLLDNNDWWVQNQ